MSEIEELRAEVERQEKRYAQLLHAYVTLAERLRTADSLRGGGYGLSGMESQPQGLAGNRRPISQPGAENRHEG